MGKAKKLNWLEKKNSTYRGEAVLWTTCDKNTNIADRNFSKEKKFLNMSKS